VGRIAGEVGCSTSVLSSMLGGNAGVAEALWCEGFERLHTALAAVDGDEPFARLAGLGRAYRTCALANRSYHAVMFALPIPGFDPSPAGYEASLRPLRLLTDAVVECVAVDPPGPWRPLADPIDVGVSVEEVRDAITDLPSPQHDVIVARDVQGRSPAEVRDELDLSPSEERDLLTQARGRVRARLDDHLMEDGA
jgi:hypothetical protein